ncbi:PhzF family phenazine biosynthesis protein [Ahrensia marina]|uniref:PhzF family phenazine biosynthesis protein n=1 Tax=Ahrensia marina TaxID=1514904 RepID=UPI0035D05B01
MTIPYRIYDVFTDTPMTGNPLAVVDLREQDLSDADQQKLAKEFNLSETVFLFDGTNPVHTARLRIYTPDRELLFAGHPTIGAAVALARDSVADGLSTGLVLMEEEVGLIRAAVNVDADQASRTSGFAEFDLVTMPKQLPWEPDKDDVALALGLSPHQIGFENHVPSQLDGGLPYFCVPLHDLDALNSITPNGPLFAELFNGGQNHDSVYIYTRETVNADSAFAARMMWPVGGSVREDPATGSGVASLSGAIVAFDAPMEGSHRLKIEQGFVMGRPSIIELELDIDPNGHLSASRLGGDAVCVAEGTLLL